MTNAALAAALDRDDDDDVDDAREREKGADADAAPALEDDLRDVVARLRVSRTQFAEYCRARARECDDISSDGLVGAVEACERLKSGEGEAFEDVARGLAKTAAAWRTPSERRIRRRARSRMSWRERGRERR